MIFGIILIFALIWLFIFYILPEEKKISLNLEEGKQLEEKQPKKKLLFLNDFIKKLNIPVKNILANLLKAKLGVGIAEFLAAKILFGFGFCMVAAVIIKLNFLSNVVSALAGFFLPDIWLRAKIKKRANEITRDLPHVIDILNLCVNAGMDFISAVDRVVKEFKKCPLRDELEEMLRETKIGKQRKDALKNLSQRLEIPEISSFIRTLLQADRMGSPISEVLVIQAEEIRIRRFQRGEEAALKAPIKLLIPLIFCILPVILIIVGGPIFIEFTKEGGFKF